MIVVGERSLGAAIVAGGPDPARLYLAGSRCPMCGDTRFPARRLCPVDTTECEQWQLRGEGTIYEVVRIDLAPPGFQPPYWLGYVDLVDDVRVFARVGFEEGSPEPKHSDPVRMSLEEIERDDGLVLTPVFRRVDPTRP